MDQLPDAERDRIVREVDEEVHYAYEFVKRWAKFEELASLRECVDELAKLLGKEMMDEKPTMIEDDGYV